MCWFRTRSNASSQTFAECTPIQWTVRVRLLCGTLPVCGCCDYTARMLWFCPYLYQPICLDCRCILAVAARHHAMLCPYLMFYSVCVCACVCVRVKLIKHGNVVIAENAWHSTGGTDRQLVISHRLVAMSWWRWLCLYRCNAYCTPLVFSTLMKLRPHCYIQTIFLRRAIFVHPPASRSRRWYGEGDTRSQVRKWRETKTVRHIWNCFIKRMKARSNGLALRTIWQRPLTGTATRRQPAIIKWSDLGK